jgi:hypothetical protein
MNAKNIVKVKSLRLTLLQGKDKSKFSVKHVQKNPMLYMG